MFVLPTLETVIVMASALLMAVLLSLSDGVDIGQALDDAPAPTQASVESAEVPTLQLIEPVPLTEVSVAEHAHRLLDWLHSEGGITGIVLARDLELMHREMCAEHRLVQHHWNPVSSAFSALLHGSGDYPKRYATVTDARGVKHRLRQFSVPSAPSVDRHTQVQRRTPHRQPKPERAAA